MFPSERDRAGGRDGWRGGGRRGGRSGWARRDDRPADAAGSGDRDATGAPDGAGDSHGGGSHGGGDRAGFGRGGLAGRGGPGGRGAWGERGSDERARAGRGSGERDSGGRGSGERASGERDFGGRGSGERGSGDRDLGGRGLGERGSRGRGSGERASGGGGSDERSGAPADPVAVAKETCLRLLTARPRTRAELHQAMVRRGIEAEVAEGVLSRFDEVGLVDDAAFAEQWVRSRHTYQGMARRQLAAELRRKGVADPVAAEAVAAVDGEAEESRARELVRRKLRTVASADELAKVRRLVGMLARKGYAEGMAYRIVREELREAGAETTLLDGPTPD